MGDNVPQKEYYICPDKNTPGVAQGNMSVKIYLNGGDGRFTSVQTVSMDKGLYSGVVVDIGKDGDMDIIGQETYARSSRPYLYESLLND